MEEIVTGGPIRDAMPAFMHTELLGNSLYEYGVAVVLALFGAVVVAGAVRLVASRLQRLAARTETSWDDVLAGVLAATRTWIIIVASLVLAALVLATPDELELRLRQVLLLLIWVQFGTWAQAALRGAVRVWRAQVPKGASTTALGALSFVGGVVIWSAVLLMALSNFGVEISALIAGLGVGGVAAALAVQSLLGDVFSALSLYTDRPFDLGDFIILGEEMGTVEKIGWRSTRVAALGGQQITFSNSDLTRSRIHNYGRMKERRVVFEVGVVYSTATEKVREIPKWIREIVEGVEGVRFDRSHFKGFGESALLFETVYYVLSPDFAVYMDLNQKIVLAILEKFRGEDVQFAFPSRSIYVESIPAQLRSPAPSSPAD